MTLLEAMAKMEGFGADVKNRPTRNNNPLNITWGDFARRNGATRLEITQPGVKAKYAVFPSAEVGFAAAKALLQGPSYKGLTIKEAIYKWAPPSENDSAGYVDFVCKAIGWPPETVIDELL